MFQTEQSPNSISHSISSLVVANSLPDDRVLWQGLSMVATVDEALCRPSTSAESDKRGAESPGT